MKYDHLITALVALTDAARHAAQRKQVCADLAREYPHLAKANLEHAAFWQGEEQRYLEAHAAFQQLPTDNDNTETETK